MVKLLKVLVTPFSLAVSTPIVVGFLCLVLQGAVTCILSPGVGEIQYLKGEIVRRTSDGY